MTDLTDLLMTLPDDPNRDDSGRGTPPEGDDTDYDALFRTIVESYGERPVLDADSSPTR